MTVFKVPKSTPTTLIFAMFIDQSEVGWRVGSGGEFICSSANFGLLKSGAIKERNRCDWNGLSVRKMVVVIFRWLQNFESSGVFWIELPRPSVSSVSWQGRRHTVVCGLITVITPYTLHSRTEMIHSKLPWMGCETGSLHDRNT